MLTSKQLGYFFLKCVLFSNDVHNKCIFFIKLVQNNDYLVSTVDTNGMMH